ncbi:hypothetical protein V6Z11_A10G187500 [Gossypium hirsutum]
MGNFILFFASFFSYVFRGFLEDHILILISLCVSNKDVVHGCFRQNEESDKHCTKLEINSIGSL